MIELVACARRKLAMSHGLNILKPLNKNRHEVILLVKVESDLYHFQVF